LASSFASPEVAADLDRRPLPAAERLSWGGQPGVGAEAVEQAVEVEHVEVAAIGLLSRLARAVEQADLGEREGLKLRRHLARSGQDHGR